MEGGWVQLEMANLTTAIARLVEVEFTRFCTICAILTSVVITEEINLTDLVKRLQERGIDPYVPVEGDTSQIGTSPILAEMAQSVLTKVEVYFNEPFIGNLDLRSKELLSIERQNFNVRLNLLVSWTLFMLFEIHKMSYQVFDVLDDWIVIAVRTENQIAQKAINEIKSKVSKGVQHIDTIFLKDADMERRIDLV